MIRTESAHGIGSAVAALNDMQLVCVSAVPHHGQGPGLPVPSPGTDRPSFARCPLVGKALRVNPHLPERVAELGCRVAFPACRTQRASTGLNRATSVPPAPCVVAYTWSDFSPSSDTSMA